jgi:hypothetical protein
MHTPANDALSAVNSPALRPTARGRVIWIGDEKLYVRGVTYGTFRPDAAGNQYHNLDLIDRDFAAMAANGINAVRVYNSPPDALLDIANRHRLRVLVDLAADQYVDFLADKSGAPNVPELVRAKVRAVSGHPAILAYSLGNEISAALLRWHGRQRIERYLRRLYQVVKAEDPGVMVTYVNYPSVEYLRLPFLDFYCFNLYLESRQRFAAYLARLQNVVGNCPLVIGEIGLDSFRNGEDAQTHVLDWQIREAFKRGCAGVFVYSWTDEWFRSSAADRGTRSAASQWMDAEPVWYTVSQLSRRWQLDRQTIYKFIDCKILPVWKVGRHVYRVAAADILRFEARNRLRQK